MSAWLALRAFLRQRPFVIVLAAVCVYAFLFTLLQFRMYEGCRMGLRDLAFFQQSLDSTLQGKLFVIQQGYPADTSVSHLFYNGWEERSLFSEHVYALLGLFLPFYVLTRTPHSFFIVNALMIAGAAIPLYLLVRRRLRNDWLAAAVALLYLLHPAVQVATLGDWVYGFHPDNIAPLCLFAMLYFADLRRPRGFWAMALLALASVESLAPAVEAVALYMLLTQKDWRRHSVALMAVAAAVFVLATLVIIPAAGGGRSPYYFAALRALEPAARHPELLEPLARATIDLAGPLLVPLALVPVLGGPAWLIALPSLLNGLAAQAVGYPIPMEYGSWHVWPYVVATFMALAYTLALLKRRMSGRLAAAGLSMLFAAAALGLLLYGPYPFSRDVWPLVYDLDVDKQVAIGRAQAEIPYDASLSVEFFAGSHFAGRPQVRWFPLEWRSTDYVLVDSGAWAWWSDTDARELTRAQRSGMLELLWQKGHVYLFKHKPDPPVQHALAATFGDNIELLGYTLEADSVAAGDTLNLTLFWRARQKPPLNLTTFVHVADSSGKAIAQKDNQPDSGTYPTSEWVAGETVMDRYRIRVPDSAPTAAYSMRVGLYNPANGQRVLIAGGADQVVLGTFGVKR